MPTFTDQGGNILRCGASKALLRATDDITDNLVQYDIAQQDVTIPADTARFVGVQYNSGNPNYVVIAKDEWDGNTEYRVGSFYNEGGTIHIFPRMQRASNLPYWTSRYLHEVYGILRADAVGGLILGESGDANRYVTMSTGSLYDALLEFTINEIDTDPGGTASTFDAYYGSDPLGWTKVAAQTAWDFDSYHDGAGNLVAHTANRYGVLWFYLETDGDMVCVYGDVNSATVTGALGASPPSTVPDRLDLHGTLIGSIVYQESTTPAIEVRSNFPAQFGAATVTDHGNISGLGDDDHTQYALLAGRAGGQTLYGGTAAGEDLTLIPTSHATKGQLFLGGTGADDSIYDHSGGKRLGIGTTSPSQQIHAKSSGDCYINVETTNGANFCGYVLNNSGDDQTWGTVILTDKTFAIIDSTNTKVPVVIQPDVDTSFLTLVANSGDSYALYAQGVSGLVRTTDQNINNTTVTVVDFDTAGGTKTAWANTTTNVITPNWPGWYIITGWTQWEADPSNALMRFVASGAIIYGNNHYYVTSGSFQHMCATIGYFDGVNDTVGLSVRQSSGGAIDLDYAYLFVSRVGF
jgi:hypothetical protein